MELIEIWTASIGLHQVQIARISARPVHSRRDVPSPPSLHPRPSCDNDIFFGTRADQGFCAECLSGSVAVSLPVVIQTERKKREKKKERKEERKKTNTLSALCAGKTEVAKYLVTAHSFTALGIARPSSCQIEAGVSTIHEEVIEATSPPETGNPSSSAYVVAPEHVFPDADALLDFVTKRWRVRFVTTDIWNESVLDVVYKRPLFILVSVDAPVFVRWGRFVQR